MKSSSELNSLRQDFYTQFSTTLAEMMYSAAYPEKIKDRVTYEGFEEMNMLMRAGNNILLCGGHFYNWEWVGMNLANAFEFPIYGIYKPLSNKYFDDYFVKARSKLGVHMTSMRITKKTLADQTEKKSAGVYALASDQSPTYLKKAIWENFFGLRTPFYPGLEYFHQTYNLPVFFVSVQHPKKGFYHVKAKRIHPVEQSIMRPYAQLLEQEIRENPVSWLWSHNRWKHVKD